MNEAEQARRPASSRLKTTALLLKGTVARRGAVAYLTISDGEMSWKPLYRRERWMLARERRWFVLSPQRRGACS